MNHAAKGLGGTKHRIFTNGHHHDCKAVPRRNSLRFQEGRIHRSGSIQHRIAR